MRDIWQDKVGNGDGHGNDSDGLAGRRIGGAARSRLSEDLEIDGDVSSAGPVDILGRIVGKVRAPDVLISASGHVDGQLTTLNLSVLGTIDGTIAAKTVVLSGSSRVQADITHETIRIESGAQFEGSLKRKAR